MATNKKLNLSFLVNVMKKYFLTVILSGIFCGIEAFVLSYFMIPKLYESRAVIRMESDSQSGNASQYFVNACSIVLESPAIQDSLIANLDLPYTKEQLSKMLSAEAAENKGEIALIARCENAGDAEIIANELLDISVEEFNRVQTFGTASAVSYGQSSSRPLPRKSIPAFTVAAILGGAAAAYIIALLHSAFDIVIRIDDDIENLYGFPTLAEFSEFKQVSPGFQQVSYMYDGDKLKKSMIAAIPENARKIVAVTSPDDPEEKSTVCLNLAMCFAKSGSKVLLIECDMVNHSLSRRFKLRSKFGLSSVLEGECTVNDAINKAVVENLDIIAAGNTAADTAELLDSDTMKTFLEASCESYNYVFLDVPPVNTSGDSPVINEVAAGHVFVIRENSTTHPDIKSAIDKVKLSKGNILGLVKTFGYT